MKYWKKYTQEKLRTSIDNALKKNVNFTGIIPYLLENDGNYFL